MRSSDIVERVNVVTELTNAALRGGRREEVVRFALRVVNDPQAHALERLAATEALTAIGQRTGTIDSTIGQLPRSGTLSPPTSPRPDQRADPSSAPPMILLNPGGSLTLNPAPFDAGQNLNRSFRY